MPSPTTTLTRRKAARRPRGTRASVFAAPARASQPATRARRPGPAPGSLPRAVAGDTRLCLFNAAATAFSRDGFDGVGVDDIARAASVNKAMLYYHFDNKLDLYRAVVRDTLEAVRSGMTDIASAPDAASKKIARFIQMLADLRTSRPWFAPLMMREMSAGGPHLDAETLGIMRGVFMAFASILDAGVAARQFRQVHPVLAYMTIMGPLMMNAARERAAAEPGRAHLPMFAAIDRQAIVTHMQETALRMLTKDRR